MAIFKDTIFKKIAGMLSQPVALFSFSFCSLVKTSSGLTGRKANVLIFSFPFLMATTLGWYVYSQHYFGLGQCRLQFTKCSLKILHTFAVSVMISFCSLSTISF